MIGKLLGRFGRGGKPKQTGNTVTFSRNKGKDASSDATPTRKKSNKKKSSSDDSPSNNAAVLLLLVTMGLSLLFYFIGNRSKSSDLGWPTLNLSLPDSTYRYEFD